MSTQEDLQKILEQLGRLENPANAAGMARYGINPSHTLGISMPVLRKLAEGYQDHPLAEALWQTGIHEARILAALIDQPEQVSRDQMERWVMDIDSWDVCDQLCSSLFGQTPFAVEKALAWSERPEEFVKRAGFVLIAVLAVHDKKAPDDLFVDFLPVISREAGDGRNFVKKAVNWALRQIGKRNPTLRVKAIETARQIRLMDVPSARWVATNALNELENYHKN